MNPYYTSIKLMPNYSVIILKVRQVAEYYGEYKQCFEGAGTNPGEKTLEDKFFEYEVSYN